jgi:4'-phosphopantetheinyl transferase
MLRSFEPIEWSKQAFIEDVGKIEQDECHIWRIDLDEVLSSARRLKVMLSDDESEKAHRFVFAQDRLRYVAGRAALRMILGSYLDICPDRVQFSYGSHGKPEVSGLAGNQLSFNLTNSGDLVLAAISNGRHIGIDLEKLDPAVQAINIATQWFAQNELASIAAVPMEYRSALFFELWTRKEAFVKALGGGLSIPLNQFDVTGWRDGFLCRAEGFQGDWFIRSFVPKPGYIAAVVVDTRPERIEWLQFSRREH